MKPLVPGSFAARGRTFGRKSFFVEEASCPGQLRCLGQDFFSKYDIVFEQTTCPRQLRCLGQNCFQKIDFFFIRSHLSRAAPLPGVDVFPQIIFFEEATCPRQLRCLGRNFFQKVDFLKKPLVPGSFAAWGRTFSQTMTFFLNKPLVPDLCAEQDVRNLEK